MRYFIIILMRLPDNNFYLGISQKGYKGMNYPNRGELLKEYKSKSQQSYSIINIIELNSEEDFNNYFK